MENWLCGMLKAAAAALASRQRTANEVHNLVCSSAAGEELPPPARPFLLESSGA